MTVSIQRVRIRVEGVVQGVGFRPFVHRLATELGLDGFVSNDERGVVIEVEGEGAAVAALLGAAAGRGAAAGLGRRGRAGGRARAR